MGPLGLVSLTRSNRLLFNNLEEVKCVGPTRCYDGLRRSDAWVVIADALCTAVGPWGVTNEFILMVGCLSGAVVVIVPWGASL